VRIQPPVPRFAKQRDDGSERPHDIERRTLDVNRWVHQRANEPRGGRFPVHSHPSVRGR